MEEKFVYNLEFPPYIDKLVIGGYLFKKIPTYPEAFSKMQHLVNTGGSEYPVKDQTGSHQITAIVEIPDQEDPAVLPWLDKNTKQILDVLFLLTIFTDRNVFIKDWEGEKPIIADHRMHQWGAELLLSLEHQPMWKDMNTGELKNISEMAKNPIFDYNLVDIGFEKSINAVLNTISNKKWQEKYSNGYFLLLFRQAIQRQIIETSFILCWSIWEHLFTLHNKKWLDKRTSETLSGYEKISFILSEYFLISLDDKAKQEIGKLARTRNRIVHYGMKADDIDYKEMEMFIRLTEQLMAMILELQPSNVFNSTEKLKDFLSGKK
jgi:hypothetical protein